MEFNKDTIKDAISKMDVSTARSRRESEHREIGVTATREDKQRDAKARADGYVAFADALKSMVASNHIGITDDELECVEFILEQLEDTARKAFDTVIRYGC